MNRIISVIILSLVFLGIGFAEDLKPPWDKVKEMALSVPKNSNGVNLWIKQNSMGHRWIVAYTEKELILAVAKTEGSSTMAVFYDIKKDKYIGSVVENQVVILETYITEQEAISFVNSFFNNLKENKLSDKEVIS